MGEEISNRVVPERDEFYCYPVGDCTTCGAVGVPFAEIALPNYTQLKYCLSCHSGSKPNPVKGYVSLLDLEEFEWDVEV